MRRSRAASFISARNRVARFCNDARPPGHHRCGHNTKRTGNETNEQVKLITYVIYFVRHQFAAEHRQHPEERHPFLSLLLPSSALLFTGASLLGRLILNCLGHEIAMATTNSLHCLRQSLMLPPLRIYTDWHCTPFLPEGHAGRIGNTRYEKGAKKGREGQ